MGKISMRLVVMSSKEQVLHQGGTSTFLGIVYNQIEI